MSNKQNKSLKNWVMQWGFPTMVIVGILAMLFVSGVKLSSPDAKIREIWHPLGYILMFLFMFSIAFFCISESDQKE